MGLMDLWSLSRTIVLITGAGYRLGLGFAAAMADAGGAVVCADINGPAEKRTCGTPTAC